MAVQGHELHLVRPAITIDVHHRADVPGLEPSSGTAAVSATRSCSLIMAAPILHAGTS
jgi:hypothetical protein